MHHPTGLQHCPRRVRAAQGRVSPIKRLQWDSHGVAARAWIMFLVLRPFQCALPVQPLLCASSDALVLEVGGMGAGCLPGAEMWDSLVYAAPDASSFLFHYGAT
jgi:hypothetical protein